MWNINSSQRHATLDAFEGKQLLIYLQLALEKKNTFTSGPHLSKAPFPVWATFIQGSFGWLV